MFLTTNLGKPEQDYRQLYEESLQILDNYRKEKETTGYHCGLEETMDQVWSEVIGELQAKGFGVDMYEETRLQTIIEIYEEIWSHENCENTTTCTACGRCLHMHTNFCRLAYKALSYFGPRLKV